jgi:hypothetical protein
LDRLAIASVDGGLIMFAPAEYEAYAAAQREADRLYKLELEDPDRWAHAAFAAQDEADVLYDIYEHAAGLQCLRRTDDQN